MPQNKVTLKSKGECYVLSFLLKLKNNNFNIEDAQKQMKDEYEDTPYFLPDEWWNTTLTADTLVNDNDYVKIKNLYVPVCFIEWIA